LINQSDEDKIVRQSMVFSATLAFKSQAERERQQKQAARRAKKQQQRDRAGSKGAASAEPLDVLYDMVGLREDHVVVDLSRNKGAALADGLVEARVTCPTDDKDLYLWYFLLKYPGKTIIFVNSIDCLRRLTHVFSLLQVRMLALHGQMQQRQRIKNLDRFRANARAVLIATDVAARGIDTHVDHVVHYQFPRDVQAYVHRSGRTARGALATGLSIALVGPEDLPAYKMVIHELNRGAAEWVVGVVGVVVVFITQASNLRQ
jgi:ATP-dependent RNA helicase DDX24/MAK5